jgi:hypothetical protein
MSRIPAKRAETFSFDGIPNQRVSDVWFATGGAYSLNWLRSALRRGIVTSADLKAYKEKGVSERMQRMWAARDAYHQANRAAKASAKGK